MKTVFLFIIWLLGNAFTSYGQQADKLVIDYNPNTTNGNDMAGELAIMRPQQLRDFLYDSASRLTENKTSVINKPEIRPEWAINLPLAHFVAAPKYHYKSRLFLSSYKSENAHLYRAVNTCFVVRAAGIPYFFSALKNNYKAGLKIACQKNSFGATNKTCKKVTGLTYGISLRK